MSKKETVEKAHDYGQKILVQVLKMMQSEEGNNYISMEELLEGDNFMCFIHALANVVPCIFVSKFSPQMGVSNHLEMNHLANKLCFEFMTKED